MKPKFIAGAHKKQSPQEPVFDFYADVNGVVKQIVADLKEKSNEEVRDRAGVNWKELEWCNAKMSGKTLQISVVRIDGSLRMPKLDQKELQKRLVETTNLLHRFEKAIREEFRKRTKKALTWIDPKEMADYQLVSMNGLYTFTAKKIGDVKTILPGQKYGSE